MGDILTAVISLTVVLGLGTLLFKLLAFIGINLFNGFISIKDLFVSLKETICSMKSKIEDSNTDSEERLQPKNIEK